MELNEELYPSKCKLYSAYDHNLKKPFYSKRYLDDPEVKLWFLLILSVIYPEVGIFVRKYGINKIANKDKLCKILNIDKRRLKEVFKFLYTDMGLILKFYPEITINYLKFFGFFDKKNGVKISIGVDLKHNK